MAIIQMATAIHPTEEMTKLIILTKNQHLSMQMVIVNMVTMQVITQTPQPQPKKVTTLVMVNMWKTKEETKMFTILLLTLLIYLIDKFNIFEGFFKCIKQLTFKNIIIAIIGIFISFIFIVIIFGLPRP